jgi:hypothetical protein
VAGELNGADCAGLGLLLGALAAVLWVALTGVFFADAALVAGFAAGLAAGLAATFTADLPAADAGLAAVVTGVAEEVVAFMVTRLSKLTVHIVYTVDFEQARF